MEPRSRKEYVTIASPIVTQSKEKYVATIEEALDRIAPAKLTRGSSASGNGLLL